MSTVVELSEVRLSFPNIVAPTSIEEGGVKKYRADLIMPPTSPSFAKFMQTAYQVALDKWGAKAQPILGMINGDRKLRCWGKGDERLDSKTFKPYVGYEGNVFVTGSNVEQIELYDAQGSKIPESNSMAYMAAARKLYGGCYVNAAVQVWAWDNAKGRGISCTLVGVQFLRDGEAFGEMRPDVSGMFKPIAGAPPLATLPDWMQ